MHKIGDDITNMGGGMNYINCDSMTEINRAHEENIFDVTKMVLGRNSEYYSLSEEGYLQVLKLDERIENANRMFGYYINVKPNTEYIFSFNTASSTDYGFRIFKAGESTGYIIIDNLNTYSFTTGDYSEIAIKFVERRGYPVTIKDIKLKEVM